MYKALEQSVENTSANGREKINRTGGGEPTKNEDRLSTLTENNNSLQADWKRTTCHSIHYGGEKSIDHTYHATFLAEMVTA